MCKTCDDTGATWTDLSYGSTVSQCPDCTDDERRRRQEERARLLAKWESDMRRWAV
ncbi:hypothetical protein [Geomicrobium sp. JCM 19039]|uniref:hypothetical protein n=1 Tax=Geomicrobium sp. JCM 19039 TaxID=1460636 RepID=UPI00187C4A39|nr:hypothetical protein [Geomicrobium sp. JCM 19039]